MTNTVTDTQFSAALRLIHKHAEVLDLTNARLHPSTDPVKLVKTYRLLVKQTDTLICSPAFMDSLDHYVGLEVDRRNKALREITSNSSQG